jgi:undecaprenyl-diphosphatase
MEELIAYDKEVFLFLNGLGTPSWDAFWMFATNKFSSIPLYAILLALSFKKFGWKATLVLLVSVALMITVVDQTANLFKKVLFLRLRPCHDETVLHAMRLVKSYCGGRYGYFSAHAGNSFAVATFFALSFRSIFKWMPLLLVCWALIVSYSRIYIGVHFPLDVITGITVGLLAGWLFHGVFIFSRKKLNIS